MKSAVFWTILYVLALPTAIECANGLQAKIALASVLTAAVSGYWFSRQASIIERLTGRLRDAELAAERMSEVLRESILQEVIEKRQALARSMVLEWTQKVGRIADPVERDEAEDTLKYWQARTLGYPPAGEKWSRG